MKSELIFFGKKSARLTHNGIFNKMGVMKRTSAWVFICLTILSAVVLFKYVNLVPRVDNNFFFSDTDAQYRDENSISHLFKRKDSLLIINAMGDTWSKDYLDQIRNLSDELLKLQGVGGVKSISN